ncbi:MAG: amino acid ABC transporter permease [Butyrivibrio sp.]|nr:amino acid ABC transporter permease [Butyrivibrio sp.]
MKLDFNFIRNTFIAVLAGVPVTFKLVLVVLLFSIPIGFLVAIVRMGKEGVLSKILSVYVSFVRGTPAMVQIYLLYNAFPVVIMKYFQDKGSGIDVYGIKGLTYAYFILSTTYIAIMSECFRGGLSAIDKGQLEAAKSVGLTTFQGYYRIVIPQALAKVLPVLCNNVTGLVKMTSLVFAMSVFDITAIAKTEGAKHTTYVEAYLVIAVMYITLNLTIELIFKILEKRVHKYAGT